MEWKGRVLVQLFMLVCVSEFSLCQHWSYGWLPGGKRSTGEVEATFRVSLSSCSHLSADVCPPHCISTLVLFSRGIREVLEHGVAM